MQKNYTILIKCTKLETNTSHEHIIKIVNKTEAK